MYSVSGAAGSLVILLVWVYYSSQILHFGAEFTQVYANRLGSRIVPSDNAVVADPGKAKQPGLESSRGTQQAAADRGGAHGATAIAPHSAAAPAVPPDTNAAEQPPWWFGIVVLGVSVTRFSLSRRWAK